MTRRGRRAAITCSSATIRAGAHDAVPPLPRGRLARRHRVAGGRRGARAAAPQGPRHRPTRDHDQRADTAMTDDLRITLTADAAGGWTTLAFLGSYNDPGRFGNFEVSREMVASWQRN